MTLLAVTGGQLPIAETAARHPACLEVVTLTYLSEGRDSRPARRVKAMDGNISLAVEMSVLSR